MSSIACELASASGIPGTPARPCWFRGRTTSSWGQLLVGGRQSRTQETQSSKEKEVLLAGGVSEESERGKERARSRGESSPAVEPREDEAAFLDPASPTGPLTPAVTRPSTECWTKGQAKAGSIFPSSTGPPSVWSLGIVNVLVLARPGSETVFDGLPSVCT